jgi:diguanylate cyclase (GGDEF)-like protein
LSSVGALAAGVWPITSSLSFRITRICRLRLLSSIGEIVKSNCRLKLYLNGSSRVSQEAVRNLSVLCHEAIAGEHEVTIIDVSTDSSEADTAKIIWTPTLVKTFPLPERRIVGNLSDHDWVIHALDLPLDEIPPRQAEAPKPIEKMPLLLIAEPERVQKLFGQISDQVLTRQEHTLQGARLAVRREHFAAGLLDWNPLTGPEGECIEFLHEVCTDVPIVVLLDSSESPDAKSILNHGAADVISYDDVQTDQFEEFLRKSIARHMVHDQLRALLRSSPDGMLILDADGVVRYANPAAEFILSLRYSQLIGRRLHQLLPGMQTTGRFMVGSGRFVEARAAGVAWFGRSSQILSLRDVTTHVDAERSTRKLLSALQARNERLSEDVIHDPLTGLLNRRGLHEALLLEVDRGRRSSAPLAALLIDCDDFKGINDLLGHSVGDQALRFVATVTSDSLRPNDRVGRVGGDEFFVLLPDARPAEAARVGDRILKNLATQPRPETLKDRTVTVSIGSTRVPAGTSSIDDVIAAASAALKMAKAHGKSRVSLGHETGFTLPNDSSELRKLLEPRRLRVVTQTIVNLPDGRAAGYELFVRGPKGEFELPETLFELARTLNTLADFDLHCLRTVLAAGAALPSKERRHVNLLPDTIAHDSAEPVFSMLLDSHPPFDLCVEISARELVDEPAAIRSSRQWFRDHGVSFALDNIGFERNSLEALILLEPDFVKINAGRTPNDAGQNRDLRRFTGVAQQLGAEIIVAGVESQESAEFLAERGVHLAQGDFWGKPSELSAGQANL